MTNKEVIELKQNLNAELVETHISWVLLTEDKAYKIKKPVKFSFLDFSDIKVRKEMCEMELQLNQRLSDIYENVIAIESYDKGITLSESPEKIIDFAVVMRRMPDEDRMDLRLEQGEVKQEEMIRLSKKLAVFHRESLVVKNLDDPAFVEKRFRDVMQVRAWVVKYFSERHAELLDRSMTYHEDFIQDNYSIFDARAREGFKRDVHGDLHTQNIFLSENIEIFDCIEFNPQYREIDVISEVAFLVMDLESYHRYDLAKSFLESYLAESNSIRSKQDWNLFHYYKMYRANVKIKVLGLRAMNDPDLRNNWLMTRVENYLRLMSEYLELK